jgi:hypothetical protein
MLAHDSWLGSLTVPGDKLPSRSKDSLPGLTAEWRQDDSEHCASAIALEQQLSLMFSNDSIAHEEAKPGPALFGREVRLEQVMSVFI